MKKILIGTLVVMTLVAGVAYAQEGVISSLPGGGWWEASQVMNVGSDTAHTTFTPILGLGVTGVTAEEKDADIEVGASHTFMPGQYGDLVMDDGFKGSAIVSSDQPIVAIGSVANNPIGDIGVSGGRAAAQYPGISQDAVDNALAFPVVKNDYKGKTTTFYVQTVEAGTIYATYTMNEGANTYTTDATTTVDGQMATFSPDDVTAMPSGCSDATCLGAVTFTSTVQLAGVYVEHNTTDNPAQILLSTRGFTSGDFDTTVVIPAVKSVWRGRTTGIQIMNVGSAASNITVTLSYQDGTATGADGETVSFTNVPAGASVTFFPGNHGIFQGPFGDPPGDDEFVGSASITSDQNMVAICNENDFAAANVTKQTVYAGFPASGGTDTVLFPLVKEFYNGNTTGLQIANVGDNAVTLEAAYVFQNNNFTVDVDSGGNAITIGPGEAFTFWGVTAYWSGDYDAYTGDYGAVTVSATGSGTPMIVGIAQEAEFPAGGLNYLDTKNYEGFNQ
ncbi:hypothetical protein DRH29_03430 [candidate division Kazan bacterium]|uniref:IgGFc-binding protein N-terminal domain-containing protein n=1 Tax=candidate division Kazan bacterium TaxID=2202143 RepID=A0A420ZC85_UNCK3|nr:MAG: hypothetical protein DRH29_03430 [candidate division Kazan bacterium]